MNGSRVVIIEQTKHTIIFDVRNMPPKWAITLISVMTYDVPTLKIELPSFAPQTNTVMDFQQWANRLGHIALDSRSAGEFNYVSECITCESGGSCCEANLILMITNETDQDLSVWSDDIVATDKRVMPVHRTFSVISIWNAEGGIGIETDVANTFDIGTLVSVLDSVCSPPLPKFMKVKHIFSSHKCVLVQLFENLSAIRIKQPVTFESTGGQMVAHITNRQLIYELAPKDTVSVNAIVRKGTGRQHIKWSPIAGQCSYRPLFFNMKPSRTRLNPEQVKSFATVCPRNVFDIEDGFVKIARPEECDACRRCERWAEENQVQDFVELPKNKLPEWQRFTVKTNGSLDAVDVVRQAFKIVQERLTGRSIDASAQVEFPLLKK